MKRKTLSLTVVFLFWFCFLLFVFFWGVFLLVKRSWCTSCHVLYNGKKIPFISYIYHLFDIFTRTVRMELDKIKYSKNILYLLYKDFFFFEWEYMYIKWPGNQDVKTDVHKSIKTMMVLNIQLILIFSLDTFQN